MATTSEHRSWLTAMQADIQAEIETLQRQLVGIDAVLDRMDKNPSDTLRTPTEDVISAVINILEESDEPMHRRDIYEKLVESEIVLGGTVPIDSLSAILSKASKEFYSLGGGTGQWGLVLWKQPKSSDNPASNAHSGPPWSRRFTRASPSPSPHTANDSPRAGLSLPSPDLPV